MPKYVFRDDDISVHTDFTLFKQVHELFKQHKVNHRLAILAKDLWENKELFWYICSEPYIDAQLHGWTHKDYSHTGVLYYDPFYKELLQARNYLIDNSKRMTQGRHTIKPTLFLPPWNKTSPELEQVCDRMYLKIDTRKTHEEGVHLFHYWSVLDGGAREAELKKLLKENEQV